MWWKKAPLNVQTEAATAIATEHLQKWGVWKASRQSSHPADTPVAHPALRISHLHGQKECYNKEKQILHSHTELV